MDNVEILQFVYAY